MKKTALIASTLFALPFVAFAAPLENIITLLQQFGVIVQYIIPILVGLAIAFFFWGLVKYIREPEKPAGKSTMIAGIVAIFIMVTLWGLILFAQRTFGIENQNPSSIPAPHFQ